MHGWEGAREGGYGHGCGREGPVRQGLPEGVPSDQGVCSAKTFCGGKTEGQSGTSEHDKGYKLGYESAKATCKTTPPQTAVQPDPEWLNGYNEGAAKAVAEFCK